VSSRAGTCRLDRAGAPRGRGSGRAAARARSAPAPPPTPPDARAAAADARNHRWRRRPPLGADSFPSRAFTERVLLRLPRARAALTARRREAARSGAPQPRGLALKISARGSQPEARGRLRPQPEPQISRISQIPRSLRSQPEARRRLSLGSPLGGARQPARRRKAARSGAPQPRGLALKISARGSAAPQPREPARRRKAARSEAQGSPLGGASGRDPLAS